MRPFALLPVLVAATACDTGGDVCGPSSAVVTRVVDGDTIEIEGGERLRYLMVDAPEISGTAECYGPEARQYNEELVAGQTVQLSYDAECRDRFDRLLAYVSIDDREVNSLLVERGYACVLYIPPNGEDRVTEFENLEMAAQLGSRGMWGACEEVACR